MVAAIAIAATLSVTGPTAVPAAGQSTGADLTVGLATHGPGTACASCHTTAGWSEVTFAHDRTGFALSGRHRDARCGACHPGGQFARPVPRACIACHRDVHAGRMGTRCDGCHDTAGWRGEALGPDAHRRTNFPLEGRHAVLPCEECHGDRRDRAFSRPTPRCIGCHEVDYGPRATAAGVNHVASGFGEDCRPCHGAWRFFPGRLTAHDACFQISAGPHSGVRCRDCHDAGVPPIPPGGAWSCAGDTADCLRCHTMPAIEARHTGVAGFQPYNRRCYECHSFR